MSSFLVRLGIEYAPTAHVEHQLLSNLFNSYSFPDDIPINEFSRVLSRQGLDSNDHVVIPGISYFILVQSSFPVTLVLRDASNNTATLTVNRVFHLVGSQIQSLTLANPSADNPVNVKVVYS